MRVKQVQFVTIKGTIAVGEVNLSFTHRFNLGTEQHNAGSKLFNEKILETCFFILYCNDIGHTWQRYEISQLRLTIHNVQFPLIVNRKS